MWEEYVAIGTQPQLVLLGLPILLASMFLWSLRGEKLTWFFLFSSAGTLLLYFALPTLESVLMAQIGFCSVAGPLYAIRKGAGKPWQVACFAMFGTAIALGGHWLIQETLSKRRIVLTKDHLVYQRFANQERADRKDIRIHASPVHESWYGGSPWRSWTTLQGEKRRSGPSITGFMVYRGPNGFIRGDELGHRLADWADTEVEYWKP